MTLDFIENHRQ